MDVSDQEMMAVADTVTLESTRMVKMIARGGSPYLLVIQPRENGERKCCWFPEDWCSIKASMPKIRGIMEDNQCNLGSVKITIRSNKELFISVNPNSVYISLRTLKDNEIVKKFYISLSKHEWNRLWELKEYIDTLINPHSKDLMKWGDSVDVQSHGRVIDPLSRRSSKRRNEEGVDSGAKKICGSTEVMQYNWRYTTLDKTILKQGDEWFFSEIRCRSIAEHNTPDEGAQLEIMTRLVNIAKLSDLTLWVYIYLLRLVIDDEAKKNCHGCNVKQSHNDGCCAPPAERLAVYLDRSRIQVSNISVKYCLRNVMEVLDCSNLYDLDEINVWSIHNDLLCDTQIPIDYLTLIEDCVGYPQND